MSTIAIIPARGGSKRLPRKNILPVNGRPMIAWTIETALKSKLFDAVIVSTDDDEIAKLSEQKGARAIKRPAEFSTDTAHEHDAYRHVLDTLKDEGTTPEFFCALYPTAALLLPEDLQGAYKTLKDKNADVVMGVSAYPIHPFKALEEGPDGFLSMVHPDWCKKQSQTYPHYVASNGTFYFMRTAPFRADPNYYPAKLAAYEIPASRAVDVDTQEDYKTLDFMMEYRGRT